MRCPTYLAPFITAPSHTHKLIFSFLILPHLSRCFFMCCCPSSINCFYVFLMLLRFSSKHTFFLCCSDIFRIQDTLSTPTRFMTTSSMVWFGCIMYDMSSLDVYIFMFKVDTRSCLCCFIVVASRCCLLACFYFDVKAA